MMRGSSPRQVCSYLAAFRRFQGWLSRGPISLDVRGVGYPRPLGRDWDDPPTRTECSDVETCPFTCDRQRRFQRVCTPEYDLIADDAHRSAAVGAQAQSRIDMPLLTGPRHARGIRRNVEEILRGSAVARCSLARFISGKKGGSERGPQCVPSRTCCVVAKEFSTRP